MSKEKYIDSLSKFIDLQNSMKSISGFCNLSSVYTERISTKDRRLPCMSDAHQDFANQIACIHCIFSIETPVEPTVKLIASNRSVPPCQQK